MIVGMIGWRDLRCPTTLPVTLDGCPVAKPPRLGNCTKYIDFMAVFAGADLNASPTTWRLLCSRLVGLGPSSWNVEDRPNRVADALSSTKR